MSKNTFLKCELFVYFCRFGYVEKQEKKLQKKFYVWLKKWLNTEPLAWIRMNIFPLSPLLCLFFVVDFHYLDDNFFISTDSEIEKNCTFVNKSIEKLISPDNANFRLLTGNISQITHSKSTFNRCLYKHRCTKCCLIYKILSISSRYIV